MNPMSGNKLKALRSGLTWLWSKISVVIVIATIGGAFFLGYRMRSEPVSPTMAEPVDSHAGHSHDGAAAEPAAEVSEWICAMHPQIRKKTQGKCPICGMKLTPAKAGSAGEGMRELTISPEAARLLDVQTTPVVQRFADVEIGMVGKIDYDETRLSSITAYVGGRLDRLFVDYTGVTVKPGDHMVELYSPELLAAQEELLQALEAVTSLENSGVGIVRETAQDTVEAVREKLRLWGLAPEQIAALEKRRKAEERVIINAPIGGVVIEKNAQEGMYVQTGTRIYTIADLKHLWVLFDAYESDLIWLRYGQSVTFTTEARPGETFEGRIAFIDPVVSDPSRTVKIRVNVANPDGHLKPGMFTSGRVTARVAMGGQVIDESLAGKWISPMHPEIVKDAPGVCDVCGMALVPAAELGYHLPAEGDVVAPLVIPVSSVLITGRRAIVYVKLPQKPGTPKAKGPTFEGREVVLGSRAGEQYIVLSNLKAGELVVTKGAFMLDSELQLRAKPSMMTPDGGGGGGHNHGGGSAGATKSQSPGAGPMAMDLPDAFRDQWKAIERAAASLIRAGDSGTDEDTTRRLHQLHTALAAIEEPGLDGHALAIWKEMSMRLINDVVEATSGPSGAHGSDRHEVVLTTLQDLRERMGLGAPDPRIANAVPLTEPHARMFGQLLDPYLEMTAALAAEEDARFKAAFSRLDAVFNEMGQASSESDMGAWDAIREPLHKAITSLRSVEDMALVREGFKPLSEAMTAGVIAADRYLDKPVYEIKCPMAFGNTGATWLQREQKVANPYFGSRMLRCGKVISTLVAPNGVTNTTTPKPEHNHE
jgi:Cu(I)/Ag(I) efflux system membrane fusion protein